MPHLVRYVTEDSPFPMIGAEGGTHVVCYVNPAFCRLSGTERRELIGHPFAEAVPEGERNGCEALLDRVYVRGESETLADQEHSLSGQASSHGVVHPLYWSYSAWAVLDKEGSSTGVMVQVTDTTQAVLLRQGLEQTDAQIREIVEALTLSHVHQNELLEVAQIRSAHFQQSMVETHHRVKNNLQLIAALIEMRRLSGAESVPISEFARLGQDVRALGVVHDILTRETKADEPRATVSAKASLEALLDYLQQTTAPRRLKVEVTEARLTGRQATSLGLVTNELVSNALKHGLGEIEVTFSVQDGTGRLQVCDDGTGFPKGFDPKTASHIGLELVERIAQWDLGGQILFGNRPEGGAQIAITFPLT